MISFVIPARNEENYIENVLKSIFVQDAHEPMEIIVVNNHSRDKTVEIAKKYSSQVKVVEEPRTGTNFARQKGFTESRGDVVIFLDADVRLPQNWAVKVVKKIRSDDSLIGISAPYYFYDFPWYLKLASHIYTFLIAMPWQAVTTNLFGLPSYMIGGNMVIKRRALVEIGGFDTRLKFFGDDTDTGRRLQKIGKVIFSPKYSIYTSGRRFKKTGVFKTTAVYLFNYFTLLFTKKPYNSSEEYEEIR